MSDPVCIWRRRYESTEYILNPHEIDVERVLVNARPLIISIGKTYVGNLSKERKYTNRDVAVLIDMFRALKFQVPVIWTDVENGNVGGELCSKDCFLGALKKLSKDPEFTSKADMFVCVVLSHGGEGYFYLPNLGKDDEPPKVLLTEVLDIFKGSNCPGLILKPKILIAQTCDLYLRTVDRSLFQGDDEAVIDTVQVPIEIDLFYYQSTISGKYMSYVKKHNEDSYRNFPEVDQDGDHPSTPLVYNLQTSVQEMIRNDGKVNLNKLVIEVNQKIERFIKSENWRIIGGNKSWSDEKLNVPLCINQLSKELDITGF